MSSFDSERADMLNTVHRVSYTWFPTSPSTATCAYSVTGVPKSGIIQSAGTNGIFGINSDGNLARVFWEVIWKSEVISTWGQPLIVGSLIQGEGTRQYGNIYGVNALGQVFVTWIENGEIRYALIPGSSGVDPDSLVLGGNNGLFAARNDGRLVRFFWANGWQTEIIPHWGGDLIPESLKPGDPNHIIGVNEHGQLFLTWNDAGNVAFAHLTETANLVPTSLAQGGSKGYFAIREDGSFVRIYWGSTGFEVEPIPHWGGALIPDSLVTGDSENVYGINEHGQIFHTYNTQGGTGFHVVAASSNVVASSLTVTQNNGVYGVQENGMLIRVYWNNGWQLETIPHWGGSLVPESLILGDADNINGVNEFGQVFVTWKDNGSIAFGLP